MISLAVMRIEPGRESRRAGGVATGGGGGRRHIVKCGLELERQSVGCRPRGLRRKSGEPSALLQGLDVAAERRLREAAQLGGGRRGARLQHRVQALEEVPVVRSRHALLNS